MRFAVALTAALVATQFGSPASARTWRQSWDVGPHPSVHVLTNDGHVRIHRGPAGRVEAHLEFTISVWGLHTRVHEPDVVLSHENDTITITARERSNNVFFFGGMIERFFIDVTLPPDCDVQVRSRDGAVEVEPVAGMLDVQTGDGRIAVHGASGVIRLWTGDGGIDADGLDGALTAHTGDGHVRVSGRFDKMDIRSGDGHVEVGVLRGSALAEPWTVATSDGGITLRIPRNLQALLDATTHDGSVHVDLPIAGRSEFSRHELRGQLNGGNVPLRVHTGDGSIRFELSE
jgi:hypothetical protein